MRLFVYATVWIASAFALGIVIGVILLTMPEPFIIQPLAPQ